MGDISSIGSMIDDFNLAIETLSMEDEEIEPDGVPIGTVNSGGMIRMKHQQQFQHQQQFNKEKFNSSMMHNNNKSMLKRRASTGQTNLLDQYYSTTGSISSLLKSTSSTKSTTTTTLSTKTTTTTTTTTGTTKTSSSTFSTSSPYNINQKISILSNNSGSGTTTQSSRATTSNQLQSAVTYSSKMKQTSSNTSNKHQQQQQQQQQPNSIMKSTDLDGSHKPKTLYPTNNQIEQHLQKQQQILIQQQQQFLQIQLEQQRLQNQIHEQMSNAAQLTGTVPVVDVFNENLSTGTSKGHHYYAKHTGTGTNKNREIAVNTEITDISTMATGVDQRMNRDKVLNKTSGATVYINKQQPLSSVNKKDKQISTTTSLSSGTSMYHYSGSTRYDTPSSSGHSSSVNVRALGPLDQSGLDQSSRTRTTASLASSLHRRLPHPTSGDILLQQQQSSRPSSSITVTNISQRSSSPKISRKPVITTRSSAGRIQNCTNVSNLPLENVTILSKKDHHNQIGSTSTTATRATKSAVSMAPNAISLNTLGYLDLDTKNVTFEDESKGQRRKLPEVPKDEEAISSLISTKQLIKEKLSGNL